jgi:hypothetical protein
MIVSFTNRQTMAAAGLVQGGILLSLHEWFRTFGHQASDFVWAAPAYTLTVLAPMTFNCLRGEFSLRQSLFGAAGATLPFTAAAAWLGVSSLPGVA